MSSRESPFGDNAHLADVFNDGCIGNLGTRPRLEPSEYAAKWAANKPTQPSIIVMDATPVVTRKPLAPTPQFLIDKPTDWFDTQPEIQEPNPENIKLHKLEIC
jgi:hypothetical protein